jgi:hypothetical protein
VAKLWRTWLSRGTGGYVGNAPDEFTKIFSFIAGVVDTGD